jgi:kynurenine formamidase
VLELLAAGHRGEQKWHYPDGGRGPRSLAYEQEEPTPPTTALVAMSNATSDPEGPRSASGKACVSPATLVPFDELPMLEPLGLQHAWNVLDRDLGTLQKTSEQTVRDALASARSGTVVNLNLPITEPDPPLFARSPVEHEIFYPDRNTLDDRLDAFYPQSSSQWDGLRHVRAREHGFFGGWTDAFPAGGGVLGIEHWAEHGIVGRGVLLDVVAHRQHRGRDYDPLAGEAIHAAELREIVAAQQVELRPGDVLCVRTGWIEAYRALETDARVAIAEMVRVSGLAGSEDVARFLWDSHAAAVACDNPTLEVAPGDAAIGSLHRRLIPMLGFAISELLDLERLAGLCAGDGRWDFLFVAVPLNIPGGISSPANAVAIR